MSLPISLWTRSTLITIRVTPFHFSLLQTTPSSPLHFMSVALLAVFRIAIENPRFATDLVRSKLGGQASAPGHAVVEAPATTKTQYFFSSPLSCTCVKDLNAYYKFHPFHSPALVWENLACKSGEGCYAFPVRRLHYARRSPLGSTVNDICKSHNHDTTNRSKKGCTLSDAIIIRRRYWTIVDFRLPKTPETWLFVDVS